MMTNRYLIADEFREEAKRLKIDQVFSKRLNNDGGEPFLPKVVFTPMSATEMNFN